MHEFDTIILGGGAAGLMCAIRAGERGRRVLLLDHCEHVGGKILISGGGRCNFTNLNVTSDKYISNNPHFSKSALNGFTQHDFIALVEKHHIPYHEKTLGQLFCDHSARDIVSMLLKECQNAHVDVCTSHHITHVSKSDLFTVEAEDKKYRAPTLVLATGGLSIPKLGATNFTYQIAHQFGLPIIPTRPALVPLTFSGNLLAFMQALAGVSLMIEARSKNKSFRESMVFTHRGLSGPAILQISSYWHEGGTIALNLLPDTSVQNFLMTKKKERPKAELKTILAEVWPQRLAHLFVETFYAHDRIGNLPDLRLKEIAMRIQDFEVQPTGTEGYTKAEVTLGGVDTNALSSKTMESSKVPGLFIIGEALDVTGWLGGYNFQWAWSSGWAAGSSL